MSPDQYIKHLEAKITAAAESALRDTLKDTDRRMTELLPANRTKTRRALQTKLKRTSRGYRGTIGLRFDRKYRVKNTKTEKLFRQAFQKHRPSIIPHFQRQLLANLKGLSR